MRGVSMFTRAHQLLRWATVPEQSGPKREGCCAPFRWGSWVSTYNNVAWAEAYLRIKWHIDPSSRLATTYIHGPKSGDCCAPAGEAGSPSNTMWPGPRLTSTQDRQTNKQTNRQTDRQTDRQRSDSIGRTVYKRSLNKSRSAQ